MAEQDPKTPVSKDMLDFKKVGCYTWVQNCTFTVKPGEAYPPRTVKWIYYSKVESVASCRFHIDLRILACVMSCEFTRKVVMKFLPAPFSWIWCKCLLRNLIHSKIFNLTKYREVLVKLNIHCSLRIQECPFEFNTSYGNDQRIHFSNNQFINRILGRTQDLPWL